MIPREDLPGALILSGIFLGLLVVAELWRRLGSPKPEHTRKLVHTGGGIACLFFPFLVESPWTVLLMALHGEFPTGSTARSSPTCSRTRCLTPPVPRWRSP